MKLIDNWKTVARKAHSMWAFYLGLIALVLPEAIYVFTRIDTNPRLWWFIGVGLIVYGIVFRLKDQGIGDKLKALAILALLLGATAPPEPAWAMGDPEKTPTVQIPADPVADAEAAALAIAVPFIAGWEGKRNQAYQDVVGVWTICYGSTRGVKPGMVMSDAECTALLRREVAEYRRGIHRYFTAETIANLPPYRDAAFDSFAFNVGIAGAGKSTATRRLNAGNVAGACEALTWWNKAGGRVIRGLVRRRSAERDLCLGRAA